MRLLTAGRWALVMGMLTLLTVPLSSPAQSVPPPWERSEVREPCDDFDVLRQPYFGDTHVHTALSYDAVVSGVVTEARDAYAFALGDPIGLPPYDVEGNPLRTAQLRRPLDFTALTDHAELFGEVQICLSEGLPGYDDPMCQEFRDAIPADDPSAGALASWSSRYGASPDPTRFEFCEPNAICLAQASLVWQDIQAAAEEYYLPDTACTFTTFVGYEWTRAPLGQNLHRNVIFRNDVVPVLPTSAVEEPTPQGLWAALQGQCLDGLAGCDVLAIPHNANLSNGLLFVPENEDGSPLTALDAAYRASMEPIMEITQHKGESECRQGVLTNDEQCSFEKMTTVRLGIPSGGGVTYDPRLFVRNVFKEGLEIEEEIGANPFRMGVIGGTDTHNSTPGLVNEEDWGNAGHMGTRDATPEFVTAPADIAVLGGIEANGGGLAVIWAEENSRDALFAAMRRREVYATSGTRPIVRFFAGNYKSDLCEDDEFVRTGYARGVPMGAEIGAVRGNGSPSFAVRALKDPEGTSLQRVQIIKGWVNDAGVSREKVFEVAGDPDNGATVDEATCAPSGTGFDTLCAVWKDPEFNASQRAFYYARVLENPTCRWSTYLCNDQGVDCADPNTIGAGMEECCNPDIPRTIQERAWSSAIWYRPEAIGKMKGTLKLEGGGEDSLKLKASLASVPADLDPNTNDITITLSDDDVIYTATIPAGMMEEKTPGRSYVLVDKEGSLAGIKKATLKINAKGKGKLSLKTVEMDLSAAMPLVDHFIDTTIQAGDYTAQHSRLWQVKKTSLKTKK